jgi:ribonuclease G
MVKSVPTICNEIYVELRKMHKQLEGHQVMLRVNPEVAKGLKENAGRWLSEMEELIGKTIIVKSDPAQHQEQFDIQ